MSYSNKAGHNYYVWIKTALIKRSNSKSWLSEFMTVVAQSYTIVL